MRYLFSVTRGLSILLVLVVMLVAGCGIPGTPIPLTLTPEPSQTPAPTHTPMPLPTATPEPTPTPIPIPVDALQEITWANAAQIRQLGSVGRSTALSGRATSVQTAEGTREVFAVGALSGFYVFDLSPFRQRYLIQTPKVNGIEFSPDGQQLITTHDDGAIIVWDTLTGEHLYNLRQPDGNWIGSMELSSDGKLLVVGGSNSVVLWDFVQRKPFRQITQWPAEWGVALSPDDGVLATSNASGSVDLWDADTGTKVKTLVASGLEGPVSSVAFSPDGKMLAVALVHSHNAVVYERGTGEVLQVIQCQGPASYVAFSQDSKSLVVTAEDASYVWNTGSSQEPVCLTLNSHPTDAGWISGWAMFVGDGQKVVSVSGNRIVVWDVASSKPIQVEEWNTLILQDMAFTPDGNLIAVTGNGISAIDVKRLSVVQIVDRPNERGAIASDASVVALGAEETASIIDPVAEQGPMTSIDNVEFGVYGGMAVAPKGKFLAVFARGKSTTCGNLASSRLQLWDVITGDKISDVARCVTIADISFSPSGALLAVAEEVPLSTVTLWNVSGQLIATIGGFEEDLTKARFSPDGTKLAIGDRTGNVYIYDLDSGVMQMVSEGPGADWVEGAALYTNAVGGLAFSNDGNLLAVVVGEYIEVLDWRDQQVLMGSERNEESRLGRGRGLVGEGFVAFSPDGKVLAASNNGGVITLWGIPPE